MVDASALRSSAGDFVRPSKLELFACLLILSAYIVADTLGETATQIVNENLPFAFAAILIAASFRMARLNYFAIWTPLFWYRISVAIFFGVGNVAHTLMNWYTLSYVISFHEVNLAILAKFNLIVIICHLIIVSVLMLCSTWFPDRGRARPIEFNARILKIAALGSCIIGYSVKYLIAVPASYGVFGAFVVPNMIAQLSMFAPPGLFLLAILARTEGRGYAIAAFLLLVLDLFVGAVGLTKINTLLPLLVYMLAFLFGRITPVRAAIAAGVVLGAFTIMQPMIEFGRARVGQIYGDSNAAGFTQRLELLVEYWTQDTEGDEQMQGALARIAYLTANAAAMDLYDSGRPSDSLSAITWMFIPRILWPEKPIYVIGAEFTAAVQGVDTSSTWMGYFGEEYYNYGYWGMLLSIPLGVGLFILSRYAHFVLVTRRWLHLPGVFLGLLIGILTDGSLVGATVNFVTVLLMHPVSSVATTMLQSALRGSRGTQLVPANMPMRAALTPSGLPRRLS